jgi:hypothetical protein
VIVRVEPTRVYRFYRGGALIDRLRGEQERDGEFPEDWVGSIVPANNPGRDERDAGLTRLEDGRLLRDADRALPALHLDAYEPSLGLPPESHAFFHVDERAEPAGRLAVLLVLDGEGALDGKPARAGDAFVLPAAAERIDVAGDLRVVRCHGGA